MAKEFIYAVIFCSLLLLARCFETPGLAVPCRHSWHQKSIGGTMMLRLFENDQEEEKQSVGDGDDDTSAIDSSDLYSALNARKREFKRGIGKRYQVCTQKGFLNVHSDPRSGPFATDNLKNKLEEGDIVTSVGEPFGTWIQHDSGGWSISKFEGFTYLKPVDEEDLD